jgi:predicted alpha/beta superfamily hydrolase
MLKALDDGGYFGATLFERQVSERATPVRSQRVKAAVALFLICIHPARAAAQEPRVVDRRIASAVLGQSRTVRISLPADYDLARRRYPVIYLLDGDQPALFRLAVGAAAFDFQLDAFDHALPPHIVVGIAQRDRGRELGDSSARFLRFVTDEVVPAVEREFRAGPFRIIAGHSLGGRVALEALCDGRRFLAAIAASPSLDSTDSRRVTRCLARRFAADSGRLTEIFFSTGGRARDRTEDGFRPAHAALAAFLRDSAPAAVRWERRELPEASHGQTPYFTLPPGLWFVHDRSVWDLAPATYDSAFAGKLDFVAAYQAFAASLARRTGLPVEPESKWLRIATLTQETPKEAVALARDAVDRYPEDLELRLTLAGTLRRAGDTVGARRTLEDALLLAGRMAGVAEARERRVAEVRAAGEQDRNATVRAELERRYAENAAAFMRWDAKGVMALRAPGFHTVTPDGVTNDRAAMGRYTEGLLHGIRKWNTLTQTIDSLRVAGDTAIVTMSQHLDRMALRPDNQVHRVETWATQRETWIRIGPDWFLWRVDQVRDQRRLVDGRPG